MKHRIAIEIEVYIHGMNGRGTSREGPLTEERNNAADNTVDGRTGRLVSTQRVELFFFASQINISFPFLFSSSSSFLGFSWSCLSSPRLYSCRLLESGL